MDANNTNDDEEPQICTVFSSTSSNQSKTIFDTIAFSNPKKESGSVTPSPQGPEPKLTPTSTVGAHQLFDSPAPATAHPTFLDSSTATQNVIHQTNQPIPYSASTVHASSSSQFESLSMSYVATDPVTPVIPQNLIPSHSITESLGAGDIGTNLGEQVKGDITEASLKLLSTEIEGLSLNTASESADTVVTPEDSPLPTTTSLFGDAPEVPFPVNVGNNVTVPVLVQPSNAEMSTDAFSQKNPVDEFSKPTFSEMDAAYDAWIPPEHTRQILLNTSSAVSAGTYFPDKSNMTTPGVIYKEDLVDKVAVNMSRIFGEVEANKRQILTADSVTQDDNGIRELIKLGCYRSAINLTKRILTLYGQGPGKLGQFSKHTPHSLQLWMTRVALLARIREFKIAESELEAFKDFQNPDMYYEYYQDLYGQGRKGSMVPFYFRVIAAEIPQYSKDYNKSSNTLNQLLLTVQQIITNLESGKHEDGTTAPISQERLETSLEIWRKREIRVYSSLANAFLLTKDFSNTLRCLSILREKDEDRKPQLTSAMGRLFLQYGDLVTSQKYFKEAASIRSSGSEQERVENLIDASLYFITQGIYTDAFGLLKEALTIQPDNFMITNNMAVCLLYMGKVKDSLALMEATVRNNTPQLLQENVILNLSTIYELENSDGFKKNALLKLISEYKGDGINLASLKMPNLI